MWRRSRLNSHPLRWLLHLAPAPLRIYEGPSRAGSEESARRRALTQAAPLNTVGRTKPAMY